MIERTHRSTRSRSLTPADLWHCGFHHRCSYGRCLVCDFPRVYSCCGNRANNPITIETASLIEFHSFPKPRRTSIVFATGRPAACQLTVGSRLSPCCRFFALCSEVIPLVKTFLAATATSVSIEWNRITDKTKYGAVSVVGSGSGNCRWLDGQLVSSFGSNVM